MYKVKDTKERLKEAVARVWDRGVCEWAGSTGYESGEKIVGQ